jgi:hypothetical protein
MLRRSPERLRSAGLSRPKTSYILGIAQKAVDGHLVDGSIKTARPAPVWPPGIIFSITAIVYTPGSVSVEAETAVFLTECVEQAGR